MIKNKLLIKKPNKLLSGRNNYFVGGGELNSAVQNTIATSRINPSTGQSATYTTPGFAPEIQGVQSSSAGMGNTPTAATTESKGAGIGNLAGGIASLAGQATSDIIGVATANKAVRDKANAMIGNARNSMVAAQGKSDSFDQLSTDWNNMRSLRNVSKYDLGYQKAGKFIGSSFQAAARGGAAGASLGPWGVLGGAIGGQLSSIFKSGITNRAAKRNARRVNAVIQDIRDYNNRAMANRATNIMTDTMSNLNANYAAYGGSLDFGDGAIGYNFMDRYLTQKEDAAMNKNYSLGALPNTFNSNLNAFGGELNTQGADFTNGLLHINNGGSHESNPLEGVPMGVDQKGTPNLVEEGETVFNDYVFSKRLKVPGAIRKKYKLRDNISFADASKKLAKESEERPNDPISQRGLEFFMEELANAQEELKMKQQMRKQQRALQQQEAMGQIPMEGMSPEELSQEQMMQEQMAQEQMMQQGMMQEGMVAPGDVNTFEEGGSKKKKAPKINYDLDWYNTQAEALGIDPAELNFALIDGGDDATNLAAFNRMATDYRRALALEEYNEAKRKARIRQDLDAGLIRQAEAVRDKYRKAYIWDKSGIGYIKPGWTYNPNDPTAGMIDYETYKGLKKEEQEGYRPYRYYAGDRVRDWDSNVVFGDELYSADDLLQGYTPEGFKFDVENEGVNLEFPDQYGKYPTWMRYAPAIGLGLGAISDTAGWTNEPDYGNADSILEATRDAGTYQPVRFNPIGNYLTYNPFDRNKTVNDMNALAAASRRALTNAAVGNRSSAMAGILAADNNYLNQLGNLAIAADTYNNTQRQQIEEFNRNTNITNSQGMLQADMANQGALAQAREFNLKGVMAAADMKDRAKLLSDQAKSDNISGAFEALGDIGRENMAWNWRNFGLATDSFGHVGDNEAALLGYNRKKKNKKGLLV